MARFLSHALPDFYDDGQHWTSERRQHAGHGTVSLADIDACTSSFTIPDNYGVFTRFLVSIGFNECETWVDSPTIYHIEAIGTEKGLNSSFPMASEWWKLVSARTPINLVCQCVELSIVISIFGGLTRIHRPENTHHLDIKSQIGHLNGTCVFWLESTI